MIGFAAAGATNNAVRSSAIMAASFNVGMLWNVNLRLGRGLKKGRADGLLGPDNRPLSLILSSYGNARGDGTGPIAALVFIEAYLQGGTAKRLK